MPVPSGSFSRLRIGGGFTISNARKSIKPQSSGFQRIGHAISVTNCPATSSMTACDGSFLPQPRASRVAAGIPMAVVTTIRKRIMGMRAEGGSCAASSHQSSAAASDPHVPGPGRRRPAPKKVATQVAHFGADDAGMATSVGLLEGLIGVGGIVGFRIVQWGGDDVSTTRPLAQVDHTAAVGAEREVGVLSEHDLSAGRTT